jgi:hypothetical protein
MVIVISVYYHYRCAFDYRSFDTTLGDSLRNKSEPEARDKIY